ncbi:hypothetical protein [Piscinibacterium candidicorallinum]|uniref:Lipoprotein n=1 Tax=Piscinibacterium candidicorallinum TaxID=1793872 RepID=A0ABV7H2N3_9BURK
MQWIAALVLIVSVALSVRACQREQRVVAPPVMAEPVQVNLATPRTFEFKGHQLTAVADFEVQARLLSAEEYNWDAGAKLAPIDFALGWNRMSDEQVLKQLTIKQDVRFFTYRWEDSPPIPPEEIIRSASNMHLIPADAQIERQLFAVQKGSRVRLRGQLVDVRGPNGFTWNSSRTREDTGNGACELVFVTGVEVVR